MDNLKIEDVSAYDLMECHHQTCSGRLVNVEYTLKYTRDDENIKSRRVVTKCTDCNYVSWGERR